MVRQVGWTTVLLIAGCGQEFEIGGPVDVDPRDVTASCDFEAVSGTKFSSNACNPVFSGTDENWASEIETSGFAVTEVMGHPVYQLWYTSRETDESPWAIGYAVSDDGIEWLPHQDNPVMQSDATWSATGLSATTVLWDPDIEQYLMSFQGFNVSGGLAGNTFGIGAATSTDGVDWSALQSNPVLDLAQTQQGIQFCWPLSLSRTSLGTSMLLAGRSGDSENCELYRADVLTPGSWRIDPTVVVSAGPGAYDAAGIASAAVVEFDGVFHMFYVGFADRAFDQTGTTWEPVGLQLSLATSSDGITWVKHPDNPFASLSQSEGSAMTAVAASVVGRRIHLWITDEYPDQSGGAVGYFLYEPDILPHP